MLKSPEKDVRNEKIGQLFTWNKNKGKPGFKFQADGNNQFEQVLAQLKADAKTHQLSEGLFDIDSAALTIKLTKPNFIRWQKKILTAAIEGKKRILLEERLFFPYENKFFTITLNNESEKNLKETLMRTASEQALNIHFNEAEDKTVEISADDYLILKKFLLTPKKIVKLDERKFQESKEASCYFTFPTSNETLEALSRKLRRALNNRKHKSKKVFINKKLNRVEIDKDSYNFIMNSIRKKSLPRILINKRQFHERKDDFYTQPREHEQLNDLYDDLKKHFERNYKTLGVELTIDKLNNCVCIPKIQYAQWRSAVENAKKRTPIMLSQREFELDEKNNRYVLKISKNESIDNVCHSLKDRCKVLLLSEMMIHMNRDKNLITISKEDYDSLIKADKQRKAKQSKVYGVDLTKDESNGVYFYNSKEYHTTTKSFDALAALLDIKVKFTNANKRTEISIEDYERWIANPIISQSSSLSHQRNLLESDDLGFSFNKDQNEHVKTYYDKKNLNRAFVAFNEKCKKYLLPADLFEKDKKANQLKISANNYKLFIQAELMARAKESAAYGIKLIKDEKSGIYYCDNKIHGLTKSFNKLAKLLKINVKFSQTHKRIEISSEDYKRWIAHPIISQSISSEHKKADKHGFVFDKSTNCYVRQYTEKSNTLRALRILNNKCQIFSLPTHLFETIEEGSKIKISADNYKIYIQAHSTAEAKKNPVYTIPLTLDQKNKVYYCHVSKNNMLRGFDTLAQLLNINVEFVQRRKRIELSLEDYELWIKHPIIRESLNLSTQTSSTSTSSASLPINRRNKRTVKRTGKMQTVHNTKGGISVKYLEDAITVPWQITSEPLKTFPSSLSGGHSILFESFQNALLPIKQKVYRKKISINSQGIAGIIKIYSSVKDKPRELFSKNMIFIRAGRKEAALLPTLREQDKSVMMIMMTRMEYNEMKDKLGYSIRAHLSPHIKLCIIESCEVAKHSSSQPQSYLRTCNIKRVITYALAHQFNLKDFILMDDNTHQIKIADKVSSEGSIEALFQLFRAYKEKGAVCATLGSYAPYKNVVRPLEATQIEDLQQHLGTKIAFVAFDVIKSELQAQNKELQDILSPFSLLWGEDYFSMLAIIQLMQTEGADGIAGVIPYSVAWHERHQAGQNKTKSNADFQLANAWLKLEEKVIENLTAHQQLVVARIRELVRDAIKKQKIKEQKYLAQLEILNEEPPVCHEESEGLEETAIELGKEHGARHAKRGYPLNSDKLAQRIMKTYDLQYAEQYINGFKSGYEKVWSLLSEKKRAYYRGEYEGFLAAKQGVTSEECGKEIIPAIYQEQALSFADGFNNGNKLQWKSMRETDNLSKVKTIAEEMGIKRANTGYDINEQKLAQIAKNFGDNAEYFMEQYRAEFNLERSLMLEEEIVTKKAQQLAIMLAQKPDALDVKKLEQTSKAFGNLKDLYQQTVTMQFEKLRQQQQQCKGNKLDNNKLQRKSAKAL